MNEGACFINTGVKCFIYIFQFHVPDWKCDIEREEEWEEVGILATTMTMDEVDDRFLLFRYI